MKKGEPGRITFKEIWRKAHDRTVKEGPQTLILMGARDEYSMKALRAASLNGWIKPVLARLERHLETESVPGSKIEGTELLTASNDAELVCKAVRCATERGGILMRGRVTPREMLHALLGPDAGFVVPGRIVSHIGFFESENFSRIILVTDGGVNIKPTLEDKTEIVKNAVATASRLGFSRPRVAMLAAVESVYLSMEASLDDAVVAKMADRGSFGDAVVDGPLSLDVALIPRSAKEKNVKGEVAGQADILVVNRIEVGNGLYKSLFLFGNTRSAGLVVGGAFPVVMTSRSQSLDSNLNSIALAVLLNDHVS